MPGAASLRGHLMMEGLADFRSCPGGRVRVDIRRAMMNLTTFRHEAHGHRKWGR